MRRPPNLSTSNDRFPFKNHELKAADYVIIRQMRTPHNGILNDIKYASFIVFVVSLMFSESVKLISLYCVMMPVFLIQLYRREICVRFGLLEYGFIGFLITSVLSGVFASDIPEYLKGVKDVTRIAMLFFIASTFKDERRIGVILRCLYVATAAMASVAIVDAVRFHKPLDLHMLGHYNYTSMYLIMVSNAIIGTILFSEIRTKAMKAAAVFLLFITITAAVMTTMRAAFVALFIFSVITTVARRKSPALKAAAAGFAAFAMLAAYLFKPMWTKLCSIESLRHRFYIWQYAINHISADWVLGVGLNNFKFTYPPAIDSGRSVYDAHNVYLNTAIQSGVAGFLSLIAIGAGFIGRWRSAQGGAEIRYAALGSALVIFAGGIFDTTFHHETGMLFAIVTGFMAGLPQSQRDGSVLP
ncbi:MAG: O-antigen ligase family protein [Candidatus Magnetominusculus sp. LBB02]|nr:O-antigen ligase family protein [Candidatus Magnetominusculus sp. LBB02]